MPKAFSLSQSSGYLQTFSGPNAQPKKLVVWEGGGARQAVVRSPAAKRGRGGGAITVLFAAAA